MSVRLLAGAAVVLAVQSSTDSGVYTGEQAARGRSVYESQCQQCHGANLSGGVGRQLAGDAFLADWATLPLERLVERVRTMPPGSAPRLSDDDYVAIVAYVLESNGFPPGNEPLSDDRAKGIAIGGSGRPAESGLVQIVGCLTRDADGGWMLKDAGDPVRTKDPNPSEAGERGRLAERPAGTRIFKLLNVFPSPDRLEGHRVEAKGLLIPGAAGRVNVTAVESVAPHCGS